MKTIVTGLLLLSSITAFAGECRVGTSLSGRNVFGSYNLGGSEERRFLTDFKTCLSVVEEAYQVNEHRLGQGKVKTVKVWASFFPSEGENNLSTKSIGINLINYDKAKGCSLSYSGTKHKLITSEATIDLDPSLDAEKCLVEGALKALEIYKSKPLSYAGINGTQLSRSGRKLSLSVWIFPYGNENVFKNGMQEILK